MVHASILLAISGLLVVSCGKPFWKSPPEPPEPVFPSQLLNATIDSVELIQEPCMAPCATYRYVLRSDGTALYEGRSHTPLLGRYSASLSGQSFERLVAMMREKRFLQMARGYRYPATDQTSVITRAFLADTVKQVERYGQPVDAPRELYEIESAIYQLGSGLRWRYAGPAPTD